MLLFFFFNFFREGENIIENEFYASLDSVNELDSENSEFVFDSIESKAFEEMSDSNFLEVQKAFIPVLLHINISNNDAKKIHIESRAKKLEGRWFKITTTSIKTDLIAAITFENSENPLTQQGYILGIEMIQKSNTVVNSLQHFFSFPRKYSRSKRKIENHFIKIKPHDNGYNYNVYNVGQGSLTALTCPKNKPIFYFDLGGAYWIFPDSYPNTLNICTKSSKTVILSHWDLDHLETARRLFYRPDPNPLENFTWIAPKQELTPFYANIARKMIETGELILWTGAHNSRINFWGGAILKCTGSTKNDSGIALILNTDLENINCILNPGDSKFKFIPFLDEYELDGLIATHHGANFDFANTPTASKVEGYIAYSQGNKYGHPTAAAIEAYNRENWVNRLDTTNGTISFTFNSSPRRSGCSNTNCDLSTAQNF
jgi:hypothetical protein